jgi:transposase-like protein
MSIRCKKCNDTNSVKNGVVRDKQRYRCKGCGYNFTDGDGRSDYDADTKQVVVRMYLNNCGFRRISEIMEIPLTTVFTWIHRAGQIVDEIVSKHKQEVTDIEILELDELYTYVKKNQDAARKLGKGSVNTPEFGLLLIGTDSKLLRLR